MYFFISIISVLTIFFYTNNLRAQERKDSLGIRQDSLGLDSLDEDINRPLGDTSSVWERRNDYESWERIDSSLTNFERLNPTWDKNLSDFTLNLGAWGTPLVERSYQITERGGFWLGLEAYQNYELQATQQKWYKIVKDRPFTELYYSQVNQKNSFVKASFAHQPTTRVYYMLHFNINNSLGFYDRQKARHQNLSIQLRLLSKSMRYEARPFYRNYNAEITENGGISNMNDVLGASSLDLNSLSIRLSSAENQFEVNSAQFTHFLHHKKVDSSLIANGKYRIEQHFSFSQSKYKYFDADNGRLTDYYGIFQTNIRGLRQFVALQQIEHKLAVLLPVGNSLKDAPLWLNVSFFQRFFSLNQQIKSSFIINNFLNAKISQNPYVYSTFKIEAEAQIAQNDSNFDLFLSGSIGYKLKSWAQLQISGLFQRFQPSQVAQNLYVSNVQVWQNSNFLQQNELHWSGALSIPKIGLQLSLKNHTIGNLIYFDTIKTPKQDLAINNILQAELSHKVKVWKISLENQLLWQKISSPYSTIRLPEWNVCSRLYIEVRPYPTLLVRTGAVLRWWSAYKSNSFSPISQQFYNQNQLVLFTYPVIDYFLTVKIWQAKVFINAENILQPIFQTTYFTAPYYPQANFLIRFGVYWSLFD
jgi:Putative porin